LKVSGPLDGPPRVTVEKLAAPQVVN